MHEEIDDRKQVFGVNETRTHGIVKVKCYDGEFYFIKEFATAKYSNKSETIDGVADILKGKL